MKDFIESLAHKHPALMKHLMKMASNEETIGKEDFSRFYEKYVNYRLLFRNKGINFLSMNSLEQMEDAADSIIYQNKVDKFIKSIPLMKKRYKKLKGENSDDLFAQLMELKVPHKNLVEAFSKVPAYRHPSQLESLLSETIEAYSSGDYALYRQNVMSMNTNVLAEDIDGQRIMFAVYDYDASKKLGSSSWCISYSKSHFNSYTNLDKNSVTPNAQIFYIDFKNIKGRLGKIGFTLNSKNDILHAQDGRDRALNKSDLPIPSEFKEVLLQSYDLTYDQNFKINRVYAKEYVSFSKILEQVESHFKILDFHGFIEDPNTKFKFFDKFNLLFSKKNLAKNKAFIGFLDGVVAPSLLKEGTLRNPSQFVFDFVELIEGEVLKEASLPMLESKPLLKFYSSLKVFEAINLNDDQFRNHNRLGFTDSKDASKKMSQIASDLFFKDNFSDSEISDAAGKLFPDPSKSRDFYYLLQKRHISKILKDDFMDDSDEKYFSDIVLSSPYVDRISRGFAANIFLNQFHTLTARGEDEFLRANMDRICWNKSDLVWEILSELSRLAEKGFNIQHGSFQDLKNRQSIIDYLKDDKPLIACDGGHSFSRGLIKKIESLDKAVAVANLVDSPKDFAATFLQENIEKIDLKNERDSFFELERVSGKNILNINFLTRQITLSKGEDEQKKALAKSNIEFILEEIDPLKLPSATTKVFRTFGYDPEEECPLVRSLEARFMKAEKDEASFLLRAFNEELASHDSKKRRDLLSPIFDKCAHDLENRLVSFGNDPESFYDLGAEKFRTLPNDEVIEWLKDNYSKEFFVELNAHVQFIIDTSKSKKSSSARKREILLTAFEFGRLISNVIIDNEVNNIERANELSAFLNKKISEESETQNKPQSRKRF